MITYGCLWSYLWLYDGCLWLYDGNNGYLWGYMMDYKWYTNGLPDCIPDYVLMLASGYLVTVG